MSRGRRHIPDATICLGRPTDPTSRAHAFPGPMSFQTACSRSCPPQDRCVRRLAQSWPNHACQIRARVAWLMPSDRSEVRRHLPRRDLLTSPRAIDVQGAPQAPSPSSAKPMLAQRQGSAPARTPRSDPTICSRLSSHACLSTPPAPGPRRRITSETVPSRTRRNWGPAPGPRDARWEEVAYPYPNFLPGVFWSRRTPNVAECRGRRGAAGERPPPPHSRCADPKGTGGRHPAQKMHAGTKLPNHILTFLPGVFGDEG